MPAAGRAYPKNLLEEAMDTPNDALVRRCFRILNAKNIELSCQDFGNHRGGVPAARTDRSRALGPEPQAADALFSDLVVLFISFLLTGLRS